MCLIISVLLIMYLMSVTEEPVKLLNQGKKDIQPLASHGQG
jgi:competence protein ComGC